MKRLVHRPQQQRHRAAAGSVGHEHAHAAPFQIGGAQLLEDEGPHPLLGEHLSGPADLGGRRGRPDLWPCLGHRTLLVPDGNNKWQPVVMAALR
jgi:hypothetical protein